MKTEKEMLVNPPSYTVVDYQLDLPEVLWPSTCTHEHGMVIEEIARAQKLTTQLQALLLPPSPAGSWWEQAISDHMRAMMKCYNSALSRLQAASSWQSSTMPPPLDHVAVDDGTNYDHKDSSTTKYCLYDQKRRINLKYISDQRPDESKRRRKENSCSIVTAIPYGDGHQWRKYGEKFIHGAKHPRNYFRCSYSKDRGCQAKRTVQQDDSNADPPKYHVVYTMPHTCKSKIEVDTNCNYFDPGVMESFSSDINISANYSNDDHYMMRSHGLVSQEYQLQHINYSPAPSAAAAAAASTLDVGLIFNSSSSSSLISNGINYDEQELIHDDLLPISELTTAIPDRRSTFETTTDEIILNLPSLWESFEVDAYLKTMMDSMY